MEATALPTDFASAARAPDQDIQEDHLRIDSLPTITSLLDAMPHITFVLNEHRQVVYANRVFREAFNIESVDAVLGLRPGEVVDCTHATKTTGGCGTTKHCRVCGAVLAILASLEGRTETSECRITRKDDYQVFELSVKASPVQIGVKCFTVFSALDISDLKRRRVLERVFFHDVINLAGGVKGLSEQLEYSLTSENNENKNWAHLISASAHEMIEQIYTQKDLSAAECDELTVKASPMESHELLQEITGVCSRHSVAKERYIEIDPASQAIHFESDSTLLKRIIVNLVKNALEASKAGEVVTIGCEKRGESVQFWVHNPGVIPEEIQSQLFQRSFSTKGDGRGIGTYSIKLLSEKYLEGNVSFNSNHEQGTVFQVSLPLSLDKFNAID